LNDMFLENQNEMHPKKVRPANGTLWLSSAFQLFRASPLPWLASMAIMTVILLVLIVIPLVQLLAIIATPVFGGGIMFGCWQQRKGHGFQLAFLFKGFEQQFGQLMIVGLIYLAATLVASMLAAKLAILLGYPISEIDPQAIASGNIELQPLLMALAVTMLLMLLLMLPVFMAYWFAPALVILNHVTPLEAMKLSFRACTVNMLPFLIYGLVAIGIIFGVLTIVVLLSLLLPPLSVFFSLLANLFLVSLFMGSMYTSYADIFSQELISDSDDESTSILA